MTPYTALQKQLERAPRRWLITGAAGFIGCNLLEKLLSLGQDVVGVDNFSTGRRVNLEQVEAAVRAEQWARFRFVEGDLQDLQVCRAVVDGVEFVLHEAALGSVPRSIEDPIRTNQSNVDAFLNMLVAARDARVRRFVYAASSSTYGDHPGLPKVEDRIGRPLSPYAVTKYVNELYADVFGRTYGLSSIGLRYFNVFGPHQDPDGPYAAVVPKWIHAMLFGEQVYINGDGETSRDFCYVDNVVQANLLAATAENLDAVHEVYNVAVSQQTTLNDLYRLIAAELTARRADTRIPSPQYRDFRPGDVRHSLASIAKAEADLGYQPTHSVGDGLKAAMDWYVRALAPR